MLPAENAPFADHHIEQLTKVLDTLHPEKASSEVTPLTDEEIYIAVRDARHALVRYKACFADEVQQKQNMRDRYLELRDKK
jgi:hypothetical protein